MTLDYQPPEPRRKVFSFIAMLAVAFPLAVFYGVLAMLVPRMEKTYADMGMKLPGVTQAVLSFSRWATQFGWVTIAIVPVALGAIVPWFVQPSARPRRSLVALLLFINSILMMVLILVVIALVLPTFKLIENIGVR